MSSAIALKKLGKITVYDLFLAETFAHLLTGENVETPHYRTKQEILDLEREAFLRLCGRKETAEGIQHLLSTGKPLRN